MTIPFFKYQATGNDFVLMDNRAGKIKLNREQICQICDRRFGIGADGLMLLENHPELDFNLVYYNADGSQSLCGNGSRAAVQFAAHMGIIKEKTKFNAYDGLHEAIFLEKDWIKLEMNPVKNIQARGKDYFMNTGSPHLVRFVDNLQEFPVLAEGRKLRHHEDFAPAGTNVNFVQILPGNALFVRTYERGVESETLSCGTGVTASALAASLKGLHSPLPVKTRGGELSVSFQTRQPGIFHLIYLSGPAKMVFEGQLEL